MKKLPQSHETPNRLIRKPASASEVALPNQSIPEKYRGERIDIALASLFPDYSRTQLTTALKHGTLLINDKIVKPKDKVQGLETITWTAPLTLKTAGVPLKAEAIPLNLVYEDEALLILNKPSNFIVHPGAGNPSRTLANALLHHAPHLVDLPRAGILHRLDKDTTGLLLVAKTLTSYTHLFRQLQARTIKRQYAALVQGKVIAPHTITTHFGRDSRNRLKMAVKREGKEAITHYTPIRHFAHFTLLNVELFTGRTHQIRVHMRHIKHPVIGDQLYGTLPRLPKHPDPHLIDALTNTKRQMLHAQSLTFIHPLTLQQQQVEAPLPEDFADLLTVLETYDVED